jgi:ABC-2 type transport system ATP-binding protein
MVITMDIATAAAAPVSSARGVISTRNLIKKFADFTAVESLNLDVNAGEVFGFLGPNGAGKTTTIRMLMGILVPSDGEAAIQGLDCVKDRVELKRRVGYLPDNPIFYDYLRGLEIARFVGQMHGLDGSALENRLAELFERLELKDAVDEFAVNYSTGMKKKLGLVCALIHQPPVLILDEPTNGLDPLAARHIQTMIRDCAAEGRTVFLSTHLLDMAQKLCHRVGIIQRGRFAAVGTPEELRTSLAPGGSLEDVFFAVTAQQDGAPAAAPVVAAAAPASQTSPGPDA